MPDPLYFSATLPIVCDVATPMLFHLAVMARGAGNGGLTNPLVQKCALGFAIRMGLPHLDPGSVGAAFVDRFDARFTGSTSSVDALLFAADVALATATAASATRTLAQVYRTAAHIGLARWTDDIGRFFIPTL